MPADIKIVPAEQVDKIKWDKCTRQSVNGLIYSTYDYIATMCDRWHGLVVNDYETVMALPWRKKFGTRYFYEPPFMQQLGLVGKEVKVDNIINACFGFANYGDLLFNFSNTIDEMPGVSKRTNLVLDLSGGYHQVSSNYKKDLQQNLKKSQSANLAYVDGDIRSAVDAYRSSYQHRFQHVTLCDYTNFEYLCTQLAANDLAFVKKVINTEGTTLCIAVFLKDEKRVYNIMNTTMDAGRKAEANHFLLDNVIRQFAGQNLLLDFEGSDLPGVKSFYEKFGARNQPFYHYHFNRLPLPLRLFKR
jgi:hypothetical protein